MSENKEQEPFVDLTAADGKEYHLTRENTTLTTYMAGRTAVSGVELDNDSLNNITHVFSEDDKVARYFRIWQDQEELFQKVAGYMLQADYETVLNKRRIDPAVLRDRVTYLKHLTEHDVAEIPDFLPDDFTDK